MLTPTWPTIPLEASWCAALVTSGASVGAARVRRPLEHPRWRRPAPGLPGGIPNGEGLQPWHTPWRHVDDTRGRPRRAKEPTPTHRPPTFAFTNSLGRERKATTLPRARQAPIHSPPQAGPPSLTPTPPTPPTPGCVDFPGESPM